MTKPKGRNHNLRDKLSDATLERWRSDSPSISDEQFYELTKDLRLAPGEPGPWPGFSPAEREAIRLALPGATENGVADLIDYISMIVHFDEFDINERVPVERAIAKDLEDEIKALNAALHGINARIADRYDDDDDPAPTYRVAEAARDCLEAYKAHLLRMLKMRRNSTERLAASMRPSAEKFFQNRLYDRVDNAWRKSGGEVDYGEKYRAFFEAIVIPIYRDPWVRSVHGVAPSKGMFKSHVDAVRKKGAKVRR